MKISNFIIKINTISKMYGQANKVMNLNLSISIILFIHVLICTTETVNTYLTFFYPVKEILWTLTIAISFTKNLSVFFPFQLMIMFIMYVKEHSRKKNQLEVQLRWTGWHVQEMIVQNMTASMISLR